MSKTIAEINEKIKKGKAVVVTAEEIIDLVKNKGPKKVAQEVDVVTTGTFSPMCSSGAYLNIPQPIPRMKLGGGKAYLNNVPVYTGFAAADVYIGANALPEDDPRNSVFPGQFLYGGAHVIEELVAGKAVTLTATAYGTDCYPMKKRETSLTLKDFNDAVMFNPRNGYQNYNVAVNLSDKVIHTYMGILRPKMGNANYCSAGQLSPLLNDPMYRTIGLGTRIFLGGGIGYVCWPGTQHNPGVPRSKNKVPKGPAGTLGVMGDLKQMSAQWLKGVSFTGYGTTLAVGLGIPIPILDEEMVLFTSIRDEDIWTRIVDYSHDYPQGTGKILGEVNYGELKSGKMSFMNKEIPTGGLSSYLKAREVAELLKRWLLKGKFLLTEAVAPLPGA
ncbi:MAG: homocysteine biosynthesis protein [Thermodesulfobacteriota bacterium]